MRKLSIFALLLALFAFTAIMVMAEEAKEAAPTHEYVGVAKCKTCHKAQYDSWLETGHAKAFDVLSDEEKKKPECTSCHMTGTMADGTVINNVECEACHGPGGDYKSPKIMSKKKWADDPEGSKKMAVEAGLIYPTAENCATCHKAEGNANFKPLDFDKSKGLIHTMSK